MTDDDRPDDGDDATLVSFARKHATWLAGLLPVVIVSLDVLFVSRGDPQILGYIVRGMTISTVFFGVLLPMAPVLLAAALAWYVSERFTPIFRSNMSLPAKIAIDSSAVIVAIMVAVSCAIQWLIALSAAILLGITLNFIAAELRRRKQRRLCTDEPFEQSVDTSWVAVAVGLGLMVTFVEGPRWAPFENVALEHGPTYTAQVLSTDGEWTVLLTAGRRIAVIHTKDVASRQPCSSGSHVGQLLNESFIDLNKKPNPRCVEALTRPYQTPPEDPVATPATSTPASTTHDAPRP